VAQNNAASIGVDVASNATVTMTNSNVTSAQEGIRVTSCGQLTLSGTGNTIQGTTAAVRWVTGACSVSMNIDQATLITAQNGLVIDESFNITVNLNRSTIRHLASGSDGSVMVLTSSPAINSALNQNTFCNVGTSTPFFTGVQSGAMDGASTFVLASQNNSGSIITCP
jgi:hypothetical protein